MVIGYGYMAMVIDYMYRVGFGLLGFGLGRALCGFECLVFRVLF
jgi:hypothetical protein